MGRTEPGLDAQTSHMYNVHTNEPYFEWDEQKNFTNQRKHGVPFSEARTVFLNENAERIPDPDHSETEERFILVGVSNRLRVLLVSYCYRRKYSIIRIISARKATAYEEDMYWRIIL